MSNVTANTLLRSLGLSNVRPPETLFHYTSGAAFLEILRCKSIWATSLRHLNDSREFLYLLELVEQETRTSEFSGKSWITEAISDSLRSSDEEVHFVTSFSEKGDLLSQWRAYCAPHSGVAIGIPGRALQNCGRSHSSYMIQCVYDVERQRRIVRQLIDEYGARLGAQLMHAMGHSGKGLQKWRRSAEFGKTMAPFLNALRVLGPLFKHPSFQEEAEWRLVLGPVLMSGQDVRFRARGGMVVPYMELPLSVRKSPMNITRVVIGPTPHPAEMRMTIEARLLQDGLSTEVVQSECPFRAW